MFNIRQQKLLHEAYNSVHDDVNVKTLHWHGKNLFLLDQFKSTLAETCQPWYIMLQLLHQTVTKKLSVCSDL